MEEPHETANIRGVFFLSGSFLNATHANRSGHAGDCEMSCCSSAQAFVVRNEPTAIERGTQRLTVHLHKWSHWRYFVYECPFKNVLAPVEKNSV